MCEIQATQKATMVGIFLLISGTLNNTNAENSAFAHFRFGSDISIDVPRNWYFLDENIRQNLNTYSEAVVRLAGITATQGNYQILIAANANTSSKKPSATMRLSVRRGKFISQGEARIANPKELEAMAEYQLERLNSSLPDNVKGISLIGVRIEKLGKYYSIVTEKLVEYTSGVEVDRLDVVYFPNVVYKLNTSYRKSEEWMFLPILKIIRDSLSIPAT
ncbi:MAG: hypothetical protein AB2731_01170 [Candidatus Thiodiazotropha sp.]